MFAICKTDCTTPEHGRVREGQKVEFHKVASWDVKKYPYLKHFKQAGGGSSVQKTMEEGLEERKTIPRPMPLGSVGGHAGPAPEAPGAVSAKKFGEMTPDELDALSPDNIVAMVKEAYGVELDAKVDRTDLILAAMEAEDNAAKTDVFE